MPANSDRNSYKVAGLWYALPVLVAVLAAAITGITALTLFPDTSQASHGNFNVHVHDDFYHPAGAFVVGPGTDHNLAEAACEVPSPAAACDAFIHVGDTITWVSPAPLAINFHSVTECTDGTFSVCGAAVDPVNPIGDSGVRTPPSPGPSGWPYTVAFGATGTYYYRCEVHPGVMRGRIIVQALPPTATATATATALPVAVGGVADLPGAAGAATSQAASDDRGMATTVVLAMAAIATMAGLASVVVWRRASARSR